jgi:50S ribosomal protein L16 3-hydroxylase
MAVRAFLARYWQRRPVLLRGAFPGFVPPVGRARLLALAGRDDVESRLVERRGRQWTLREGPLPRRALPPLARPGWTLLVQGLDAHDDGARALLDRFRFVPDARLDDLMASFATDGGGVGPHVDAYDVFLLQAAGRRRWRVSRQHDLALVPGAPLKLLARFRPAREYVLGPGDMLYLPPGVAHEGVALGECITYSIGFRAPAWQELLDPWFARFAERAAVSGRYADPGLAPARHPARLPAAMVAAAHAALAAARPAPADTERFLLEYLSEPKAQVVFDRPARAMSAATFARRARREGLRLDRRTRMLTGRAGVAINGELHAVPARWRPVLGRLADRRALEGTSLERLTAELAGLLASWRAAGWLHLGWEG